MTLKQQAAQLWSQGRTIAQIQSALRVTVSMPGGIGDIQRNFSTGNFAVHPEMCFVQPDKFNIIDTAQIRPGDTELRGDFSGETLAEVQLRYPGAIAGNFEEWIEKKQNSFIHPPQVVTEARFWEMLEVLPPVGWKTTEAGETFKLSERTSGLITAIFCRIGEKYFELSDKITLTHDEILAKCKAI